MRAWLDQLGVRTGLRSDIAWRKAVIRCFSVAAVFHVVAAWFSHGYLHLDEHFQIIEFANLKLQRVSAELLTWEVAEKARPWLQPAITFIFFKGMQLLGTFNPVNWMRGIRFFSGSLACLGAAAFVLANYRSFTNSRQRYVMLYSSAFFCIFPWLHVRTSSENYSATAMLLAISALLLATNRTPVTDGSTEQETTWSSGLLFISGFFCGIAFNFRYQLGFMILGFAGWCIAIARLNLKKSAVIVFGFLLANIIAILVDRWGWGDWSYAPWNYFHTQVIEGVANKFGKTPWWYFSVLLWKEFPQPFGALIILALLIAIAVRPRHLATFCAIPFLLMHTIFGHKEARFLIPVIYLLPFFIAVIPLPRSLWPRIKPLLQCLVFLNFAYLLRDVIKPLDADIPYLKEMNYKASQPSTFFWEGHNPFSYYPLTMYFYQPTALQVAERPSQLPTDTTYYLYRRVPLLTTGHLPTNCVLKDHSFLQKEIFEPWLGVAAVAKILANNDQREIYLCIPSSQLH